MVKTFTLRRSRVRALGRQDARWFAQAKFVGFEQRQVSMGPLKRLPSIDAMRGITVAGMLLVNDPGSWSHVYAQLSHSAWNGCTLTDLVFPFFLFMVGVSIALAILPRLEQGAAPRVLRNAALWRALRIVALGLLLNAIAAWFPPGRHIRFPGVLQRIGVCFAVAAMIAIYLPRRGWWIAGVALLAAYTALLLCGGSLAKWDSIVDHVDGAVFGRHVWEANALTGQVHDPEGLLSTLPAIVNSLLGLYAGVWLRECRFRRLAVASVIALALGWLWSPWIPFNKNLWTPSFVLWTSGCAALVLLACHWLVELRGWPPLRRERHRRLWASELVHAGSVAGLGLAGRHLHPGFRLFGRPVGWQKLASLGYAIVFVAFWWIIVWWMERRRIYFKL